MLNFFLKIGLPIKIGEKAVKKMYCKDKLDSSSNSNNMYA